MDRDPLDSIVPVLADLTDDHVVTLTCEQGHESTFVLQQQRFEVLFEMGAMALLDGYTREAVSSVAVAFERFIEFFVRAAALDHGVDPVELARAWKLVSRQSERQLGAFVFLSLLGTKKAPELDEELVRFRNDVVHKGTIPSAKEASDYATSVFQNIVALGKVLRERHGRAAGRVVSLSLVEAARRHREAKKVVGTLYTSMFLDWALADEAWACQSFKVSMANLKVRRWATWARPDEGPESSRSRPDDSTP